MKRRSFVRLATGVALFAHSRGVMQPDVRAAYQDSRGAGTMRQTGNSVTEATPSAGTLEMSITRLFSAPVARVWQAWSDPALLKRWWEPKGWTAPVANIDFREGGTSLVCMRSPEGQDFCNTWTYLEIEPTESIEFVQRFSDADGNPIAPADVGLPPEIPQEVRHAITFEAVADDETKMTVTEFGYTDEWVVELSRSGMNEVLDKLAVSLVED